MKKLSLLFLFMPCIILAQTFEEGILTLTEFKIKQGHSAQFEDGVKKWKECYNANGGENTWGFWSRVQGEGRVYGVTSYMENWAAMDEDDESSTGCGLIVSDFIMPHIEKTNYNITTTVPDWSRKTMDNDGKLVWVTFIRVKDSRVFSKIVKEVTSVIAEKEGEPRGYWYSYMGGGEHDPDYMVSEMFPNYAALDTEEDSPFKVYMEAKGEKKANQMMEDWNKAVDASWSYIWEYNEELSN
jgi:hypothetical protein